MNDKICSFSGHRAIPPGAEPQLRLLLRRRIAALASEGCTGFLCGGAVGFDTLAAEEVLAERIVVKLREPNARFYIGEGKAREVKDLAERLDADVIVFDDYLTLEILGNVMTPLYDEKKVPREEGAFIAQTAGEPIRVLFPILQACTIAP